MKKLWQLCACAAEVLAGLWLTARILLPVGLPFLLGLGLARLARPLAARLRRLPRGLAAFLSVTAVCLAAAAALTGLGWALWRGCAALCARLPGLLSTLAEPLQRLHAAALHLASRLPDGMGEAAAQWVDRLFAGGSVVADSVSQGVFGCVTRVLGWMPQLLLFGLTALLSAYFLAGDAPRLRALAARHVPEEWRARGGQLLVRLRAALRGYVLAQGKLLLVTFGVVSLGLLAALRRPHAVLLGALIAVVDALPVLGSGTVLLPWAAVSLLRGSGGLAIGLTVTYAAAAFARSALEPRLLGRQIGLPPLLTLLSLYAGYRLFGLAGMILLPLAVLLAKQVWELAEGNGGGIDGAL